MTDTKKPREFFLIENEVLEESHNSIRPFAKHIVLREVIEGEPLIKGNHINGEALVMALVTDRDKYKSLADELAAALENAIEDLHGEFCGAVGHHGVCQRRRDDMAKYRKVISE